MTGQSGEAHVFPTQDNNLTAELPLRSGIPSFLGMGEVDPDVWHLKYRSTEAAM